VSDVQTGARHTVGQTTRERTQNGAPADLDAQLAELDAPVDQCSAAKPLDGDVMQPALIRAVVVGGTGGARDTAHVARPDQRRRQTRVLLRVLGEQTLRIDGCRDVPPPSAYSRAWEVGLAIACLPVEPTLATLGAFIWPDTPEKAARGRVYRALSDLRQVLRDGLGPDAERVVMTVAGVCRWNGELVTIDANEFLKAIQRGQSAERLATGASKEADRAEHRSAARTAYQHARDWWQGELLPSLETRYAWLEEPIKGPLTLRTLYVQQHRQATQALAELLVADGDHARAAQLYHELLADPGPPDSRYQSEQERYEACAQALYGCYAALGDRRGLERARDQLMVALRQLDVAGRVRERTVPSAKTTSLYERLWQRADSVLRAEC
jgi:hypothetical protein